MNTKVLKYTTFKEFVDFAFSLKEMEEVKKNGFPIPNEMTFILTKKNHELLQKEIIQEKKISAEIIDEEFEVELYGITFKFKF